MLAKSFIFIGGFFYVFYVFMFFCRHFSDTIFSTPPPPPPPPPRQNLKSGFVGTEHILLALCAERDSPGVQILEALGVSPGKVTADVLQLVPPGCPVSLLLPWLGPTWPPGVLCGWAGSLQYPQLRLGLFTHARSKGHHRSWVQ